MSTYRITFLMDADEEPDVYPDVSRLGGYDVEIEETESPLPPNRSGRQKKPKAGEAMRFLLGP